MKIPSNPIRIPWKSHKIPLKSHQIPWKSHENPIKSHETTIFPWFSYGFHRPPRGTNGLCEARCGPWKISTWPRTSRSSAWRAAAPGPPRPTCAAAEIFRWSVWESFLGDFLGNPWENHRKMVVSWDFNGILMGFFFFEIFWVGFLGRRGCYRWSREFFVNRKARDLMCIHMCTDMYIYIYIYIYICIYIYGVFKPFLG